MSEPVFCLFAHVIPIRGAVKFVLYDLQREDLQYIPEGLYEILTRYRQRPLNQILEQYEAQYHDSIHEYFSFLEKKELGIWTQYPDRFLSLSTAFHSNEIINNAIVDIGESSSHHWQQIFGELEQLKTKFLELRWYTHVSIAELIRILGHSCNGRLRNITLYLPYQRGFTTKSLYEDVMLQYSVVGQIIVHTAPELINPQKPPYDGIWFIPQKLDSEACCGVIGHGNLRVNIPTYTEGLQFNTCLNKKISIDQFGQIKNCPSMTTGYGKHGKVSLLEVALISAFKKLWTVTKDTISKCQDCELRYACTDCRAYLEDPDNPLSKPAKCGYDPYTE